MDYQEAMAYIEQLNKKGISLGLERMEALLQYLDNPQNDLRIIHVAGTNGKGSVCAFIESALQQAGLRIGRYISPSVYDYLFRVSGIGSIGYIWIRKLFPYCFQMYRLPVHKWNSTA